jgi:hypothetical protein
MGTDSGQLTTIASSLNSPSSVALDADGNVYILSVYIADGGNWIIEKWAADSGQLTTLISGLNNPPP